MVIFAFRMKTGFDNNKYLQIQSEQIKKRIAQFGDKLYLEFGGKLFDDNHASRVLPGFLPDSKLQMLMQLKDEAEILIVISALDIEKNKVRGDLGITYDEDVLRLRDEFEKVGLMVSSVVITHYNGRQVQMHIGKDWNAWESRSTTIIPLKAIRTTWPLSTLTKDSEKTTMWRPQNLWW